MLYDHLAMTKAEAVDILTQKYADGISTFENIEQEALIMANIITEGIAKQFPHHFRCDYFNITDRYIKDQGRQSRFHF